MSEETTKPHPAIRTFAQDLTEARKKRNQPETDATSDESAPAVSEPAVKKPVEHFKAQAPQKTTRVEPTIVVPEKKEEKKEFKIDTTKKQPSQLPAFHELQEEVNAVTLKQPVKKKYFSKKPAFKVSTRTANKTETKRTNIGYDATIITDTKHKRFNLFTSIQKALGGWFRSLTVSKKKKAPVYTVPDTQRRKGVIQKATSKSGSIFTTDSAELKAKIKQRQKLAAARKAEEEEAGKLSWSPFTDAGFALLESPEESARVSNPHNVAVAFKQQTRPDDIVPEENLPTPPTTPVPSQEIEPDNTPVEDTTTADSRWEAPAPVVAPVIEKTPEPEPTPEPITEVEVESEIAAQAVSEVVAPTPVQKTNTSPEEKTSGLNIQSLNTNALAMSIVAVLSGVIVIFFVAQALVSYLSKVEPVLTIDNTSYLRSATPNPVSLAQLNSMNDIPLQAGIFLDVQYVDTQLFFQNGEVIPPATILSALQFRVLPSFSQSLSDVRFAQINQSEPILVIEFTNIETAMGGFLAWEDTMAQDLKELYLITQSDLAEFSDGTASGKDIRILQSPAGEVLAVYGIVSSDTALVTGSIDTFIEVVNSSFSN